MLRLGVVLQDKLGKVKMEVLLWPRTLEIEIGDLLHDRSPNK
jgi:hypothetical protein